MLLPLVGSLHANGLLLTLGSLAYAGSLTTYGSLPFDVLIRRPGSLVHIGLRMTGGSLMCYGLIFDQWLRTIHMGLSSFDWLALIVWFSHYKKLARGTWFALSTHGSLSKKGLLL